MKNFVGFWEYGKPWKIAFEINWPLAWHSMDFCDNSPMWQDKCLISLAAWFNLYSELGLWLSKIYGYFLASCVLAWFFPFFGIFAFFIWSALTRILELYQKLETLCFYVRLIRLTFMKPKFRFLFLKVRKYMYSSHCPK